MHDLNELAAFAAVMQSGSLTVSARELGLAKSTLSRRISQLETRLGQPLLRRQANRLIPTEAGTLFLNYCQQILRLAEQSQQVLEDLREEVSGELVVHVHSIFARGWFARQMEHFLQQYPGTRLDIRTQWHAPQAPEETSLCLWLGPTRECGLRQEVIGGLERGVYAHPDYLARHGTPHHPRELSDHAWVDLLGETHDGLMLWHPREGEFQFTPAPSRLRVDQMVMHSDAIARGQGLGLLPCWLAEHRLAAHPGSLQPCLTDWRPAAHTITLLYPFGRLPRKTGALLEHLRQSLPEAWQPNRSPSPPALSLN
ncbi:LysR family transcriptional regulator [Halomonas shantousis]